jgi:hypothetical protein
MANENTDSHDEQTFKKVVEVLCASGTDKEDYELHRCRTKNGKTRLEDVARVMNDLGSRNRKGGFWNKQSLKKVIQRTKKKTAFCKSLVPDWSAFNNPLIHPVSTQSTNTKPKDICQICDSRTARPKHKTCSVECGKVYQELINHSHKPEYWSFIEQIRSES